MSSQESANDCRNTEMTDQVGRRNVLIGVGAALLAADAFGEATVDAKELTPTEKANVKLYRDFQAAFDGPNVDVDKVMMKYLAPNCSIRWFDDEDRQEGREAAIAAAKGAPFEAHPVIKKIFAHGPLVAASRVDTIKRPGKTEVVSVASVCIIKDGLVTEYCDYILSVEKV
jgi:hypothetical protein